MGISIAKPVDHRPVPTLPLYDAQDLTQDGDLAQIRLDEQIYTLRITRAGKLILTK
jgi:hemin uptake protein HemP